MTAVLSCPDAPPVECPADESDVAWSVVALAERVERLATQVAQFAELAGTGSVETMAAPVGPVASWVAAPNDPATVEAVLDAVLPWVAEVYLRYPDAVRGLPECWVWHPDVVEELVWLRQSWLAAYQGPAASADRVGEWHERYRPGVVRRITATAGTCSVENHQPTRNVSRTATTPATVVAPAARNAVTAWWAGQRDQAPAVPAGPDHIPACLADSGVEHDHTTGWEVAR